MALMRLGAWHRAMGDEVFYTRRVTREPGEPDSDIQYGSTIFDFSRDRVKRFRDEFPAAILGGTGVDRDGERTVDAMIGSEDSGLDYSGYPEFKESIGYLQRGCRLSCKFCVVPKKEGKPRSAATVADVWRGPGFPKKLHLLDNDFFGNPDWPRRIAELRDGKFRVCFSQGVNTRLLDRESAAALATLEYRDTKFKRRRLYTAWDNLKDETVFFRGVELLRTAGVPPTNLLTYMLVGYEKNETWDVLWYRFNRMVGLGIKPYPMVFDRTRTDLLCWQRWVVMGLYRIIPWPAYVAPNKSPQSVLAWMRS